MRTNLATLSIAALLLAALTLPFFGQMEPAPAAPTPAIDKTNWAPWTDNSVQPPQPFQPSALPLTTAQPGDGPTEQIYRAATAWFDEERQRVPDLVPAAEAIADHVLAGGHIYIMGSAGMQQELFDRAGGFTFVSPYKGETLTENDVVIVAQLTPRDELLGPFSAIGLTLEGGWNEKCLVVRIASHNWPLIARTSAMARVKRSDGRFFDIDTHAPLGSSWADVSLDQMATAATAWALQGEVFAAATRKGTTLTTEGADAEPHGPDWDKMTKAEKNNINVRFPVPPIPATQIATKYLKICQKQVAQFLDAGEAKQVRLAAQHLAAVLNAGHEAWAIVFGHIHLRGNIIPRSMPGVVLYGRPWQWRPALIKPGDCLIVMGYLDYPRREATQALRAGASHIITFSAGPGPTDDQRTHIDGSWSKWDTVIDIPHLPVRILPSSGVVQTPEWYALMAETAKLIQPQ